jgi:tetratricopeptide (TPR) repeat protein
MKKVLFLCLFVAIGMGLQAQDPVKDMKKAARLLGTYNLDPANSGDKLDEAIALANASIGDPLVQADPASWQAYGDIFLTMVNNDVGHFVIDPAYKVADPGAAGKAYKGYAKAAEIAQKAYQTKDAMKALSAGMQNIYYIGSALYQTKQYAGAYEAFKATYDGYELLKKNNESTSFDAAEHDKALYYAGLCAQQAGLMEEAKTIYKQLVDMGTAEAGVYEALIMMYQESDPALSEQYLKAARAKYPDDQALLYAEINQMLAKGELTSLIANLEKALSMDPNNASIYITLGQIYDKLYQDKAATDPTAAMENFNKAMSYYQQALEKDARSFDALYSIGALYYNEAAVFSQELNTLADDYSAAGTKKYEAKKAQMDEAFTKALPFFQQAEQLNPKDINTLVALKEIYARQDKFDQVEVYKKKLADLGQQ